MAFDPAPILARLQAASSGPWQRHGANIHDQHGVLFTGRDSTSQQRAQADRDAEFVAHAPADIALLLQQLRELQGRLEPGGPDGPATG